MLNFIVTAQHFGREVLLRFRNVKKYSLPCGMAMLPFDTPSSNIEYIYTGYIAEKSHCKKRTSKKS